MNPSLASDELTAIHDLAMAIALEVGALQMQHLHGERTVNSKSTPTDAVTEVDHAAEALIVKRILEARPHDSILGEEGARHDGTSGVHWIVDPLDGTVNYLYRRGDFAVSLGVQVHGVPTVGVVHDPSRGETYHAILGRGAWRNDARIHASNATDLGHSLVGTGFGYDPDVRRIQGRLVARMLPQVRDIRRAGSAALDVCAVASGRLDGFFERGVQAWDVAGAQIIVTEAGGLIEPLDPPHVPARTWVTAAPGIYAPLRAAVIAASNE
jgi:fructose-1,6-bisphosphatase/inositol monophosphatase family enzyme